MTHHEFDLSDLLDALRAGEMTDTIRASLEWIIRELIEAEATEKIGAAPFERSDDRTTQRNGHRSRLWFAGHASNRTSRGTRRAAVAESERNDDRVVEWSDHGEELGDQVYRRHDPEPGEENDELGSAWHARVPAQFWASCSGYVAAIGMLVARRTERAAAAISISGDDVSVEPAHDD